MTPLNQTELPKNPAPHLRLEDFQGQTLETKNDLIGSNQLILNENVYIPTGDNFPEELPSVVTLGGTGVLTYQNITAIISAPGLGKSSCIEAIALNLLNNSVDSLGFQVDQETSRTIVIDNERTSTDVAKSFQRMYLRAKLSSEEAFKKVVIAGMRSVYTPQERMDAIETLLKIYPCGLLLIDGVGDLVTDVNDINQVTICRTWLRYLTSKYKLSIIVTLHPNTGTFKPRGHLGSEICREAECVLLVKMKGKHYREITSDFEFGKNRNNPSMKAAFRWSETKGIFLSAEYEDMAADKKSAREDLIRQELLKMAKILIPGNAPVRYTDLVKKIKDLKSEATASAKRRITKSLEFGIFLQNDLGHYLLNPEYCKE